MFLDISTESIFYHIFIPLNVTDLSHYCTVHTTYILQNKFVQKKKKEREREFLVFDHNLLFFKWDRTFKKIDSSYVDPPVFSSQIKAWWVYSPKSILQNIFLSIPFHSSFPSLLPCLASLQSSSLFPPSSSPLIIWPFSLRLNCPLFVLSLWAPFPPLSVN